VEITPLGYLVLPLGLFLFIRGRRALFWALVVSIPFFDAYVLHLTAITAVIRPSFYFGGLLLMRQVLDGFVTGRFTSVKGRETRYLLLFWLVISFSLIMPLLLEGKVLVQPIDTPLDSFVLETQQFRRTNLTQLVYPLFMGLVFLVMIKELRDYNTLRRVFRLNVGLALFVVGSGVLYNFSLMTGQTSALSAVYWFLTGNAQFPVRPFSFGGVLPRMFTIAGEPGYTGAYLLFVLGSALAPVLLDRTQLLWGKTLSKHLLIAVILTLLLSAGTTTYAGFALFAGILVILLSRRSRWRSVFRVIGGTMVLLVIASLLFPFLFEVPLFQYLYHEHIQKFLLMAGSGPIRWQIASHGFELFAQHPLLGVGYGSNRSSTLLTFLLSNVGLLGTLPFFLMNWVVFRKGLSVYQHARNSDLKCIALGLLTSFGTLFGLMQFAKSESSLLYMYYWLLLAMLVASYRIMSQERTQSRNSGRVSDLAR